MTLTFPSFLQDTYKELINHVENAKKLYSDKVHAILNQKNTSKLSKESPASQTTSKQPKTKDVSNNKSSNSPTSHQSSESRHRSHQSPRLQPNRRNEAETLTHQILKKLAES